VPHADIALLAIDHLEPKIHWIVGENLLDLLQHDIVAGNMCGIRLNTCSSTTVASIHTMYGKLGWVLAAGMLLMGVGFSR
jgi:hypothetical protein